MKMGFLKVFALVTVVTTLIVAGCQSGYQGQLLGVQDRPSWNVIIPYGTVYIPSGQLHIGPSDQDINNSYIQRPKSVSIHGFYMDDTEITNNEYRQFVYWVRDSVAAYMLGEPYVVTLDNGTEQIDWREVERDFDWVDIETGEDEELSPALEDMYVSEDQRFWGRKELDVSKLIYEYYWIDYRGAANQKKNQQNLPRSDFFIHEAVMIYPDTLVWVRDFTYSFNEPMTKKYFYHPAYDDYPVVGVTWPQAKAFSVWRSKFWNDYRRSRGEVAYEDFRLPTEGEWEYAARGGKELSPFPWGGPYVRNTKGCILANFKPGRGDYPEDGGFYTVRADAYWPNDFGLYNMAGNVSEWCSTSFYENAYSFNHDLNPEIDYRYEADDTETMKRKVIRGGSWKDIGHYIQTGTRSWEYADSAKSYVGFRNVQTFLGRSIND
jgi:gliding motility-associated lipoprotein GldK